MSDTLKTIKISFTKTFNKGLLKGMSIKETMSFVSIDAAMSWVDVVNAKKRLGYKVSNVIQMNDLPVKSRGHILFKEGMEYFTVDNDLYVAPVSNAISTYGFRLGRWECSMSHAQSYPEVYGFLF